MGTQTAYHCDCGYETSVTEGRGMILTLTTRESRLCPACQDIVAIEFPTGEAVELIRESRLAGRSIAERVGPWMAPEVTQLSLAEQDAFLADAANPSRPCPHCQGPTTPLELPLGCPKCGEPMRATVLMEFD